MEAFILKIIETETCLNLCEIADFPKLKTVISKVKDNYKINRIYIGSYFCDLYFLNCNYGQIINMNNEIFSDENKITLVVPVATEKNLEKVKCRIVNLIKEYMDIIDEITVNDYGMLEYLYGITDIKLNMGRIFFKDYRDPRYSEYFEKDWTPKYNNEYLRKIIERYKINEIEIDVTHKSIRINDICGIITGLHTPFTYMTTGKICEYASMYKGTTKKFRPGIECARECN